ncbi:MAG: hypothetical protein EOP46_09210 [Sphingobacteriaceae bacterium]|nr:MAG: hypothetical protein EOP46_09210 [Sphingobacteriaceae bacterium]
MTFKLGDFFPKKTINEPLLDLDNPLWASLEGGYKSIYDASVPLKNLKQATTLQEADAIYQELWDNLHHQGDVGLASYYALPYLVNIAIKNKLVDYNVLGLVSVIEIQRHQDNPKIPSALFYDYNSALQKLAELAILVIDSDWDLSLTSSALAAIAVAKGQIKLAEAIMNLDSEDAIDEFLEGN